MKNKRSIFFRGLIVFIVASYAISILLYKDLFKTFYQQDEWMALGSFFGYGLIGPLHEKTWMQMLIGGGRPFIWPLHAFFYTAFPFQIWPLALFSLLGQPSIGILTFIIVYLLTGSMVGATTAGLFFLLSYNGSQTVSWFATSTITLASTFFGLLSVIFLLRFIRNNKTFYLIASQISVICSFFFKESGFMFVLFLPFLFVFFSKGKESITKAIRMFSPIILYFSFDVIMITFQLLKPIQQTDKFIGQSTGGIGKIIGNALFYPIISLSQVFIPFSFIKKIDPGLAEISIRSDSIFVGLSIIILVVFIISAKILKYNRKPLILSIVFTLCSFVPYAVLDRGASYLSSRYFYVGMIGASMLVGVYGSIIWDRIIKKKFNFIMVACGICIPFLFLYAYKNIQFIKRDIQQQVLDAQERKAILNEIKQLYPILPKNPVFYVTGDHPGYYYVENQKVPFQQGMGYTLMVWYYPENHIFRDILKQNGMMFWDINTQGYTESNGNGFGYYWDLNVLKKDLIEKRKFTKEQIIGIFYYGGDRKLKDISKSIKDSLL